MKKIVIYTLIILLIIAITVGATYAFFSAQTNTDDMDSGTTEIEIIYNGGKKIEGNMDLVTSKEGGYNTTVNIRETEESVHATANLFINVDQITSSIATEGLIWEVYKTFNGTTSFVNSGTFVECGALGATKSKCKAGDKLYMVTDYELSTESTAFTIYIWLNGDKVGNEVLGATFSGTIATETNKITGDLS